MSTFIQRHQVHLNCKLLPVSGVKLCLSIFSTFSKTNLIPLQKLYLYKEI